MTKGVKTKTAHKPLELDSYAMNYSSLLETQYEKSRPTLSCEGSLLTRRAPSKAGPNMIAAA